MSDPHDPGDNPFAGIPLFGDLAKLIGQQGGASWDAATQLAVSIASGGTSEANVEPLERIKLESLQRLAEMAVEEATGASLQSPTTRVTLVGVNRTTWAQQAIRDYKPLFEKLATSLSAPPPGGVPGLGGLTEFGAESGADPMAAMLGGLMKMMAPMMLGMTAGSMVGHLAQRALGTYHLPIPRPQGGQLQLVVPSIVGFAEEWELGGDDVRLWVSLSELTTHTVLSRPHIAARLNALLEEYASGFRPNPDALEDVFGSLDPSALGDVEGMRKLFGDPTVLLGAIRSPAQHQLLPRLESLVCAIVGYVDHVMDGLATKLLGSTGRLTEALRRRRVEATDADRFVERLLGLELTQARYDAGAAFAKGVVERGGEAALNRLWESDATLPTPAELEAPGLWLARLEYT